MIINGKYYSNNVTIINGQVIEDSSCADAKNIDELKKESVKGIKRIYINTKNVAVNVLPCDSKEITAHLHGSIITNGEIKFSVERKKDEIYISVIEVLGSANMSIFYNTIVKQSLELVLDVMIPSITVEYLRLQSLNGSLNVGELVCANKISINNINGDSVSNGNCKQLEIGSKNGGIKIVVDAKKDINLDIFNTNGKIEVRLSNIAVFNAILDSKNGNVKNKAQLDGKYKVTGRITSQNGNIKIK